MKLGVDLFGYHNMDMGMGQAARAAALALLNAGVDIAVHPISNEYHSTSDATLAAYVRSEQKFPINIFYFNANETFSLKSQFGAGVFDHNYNIGVWNWELERLPQEWAPALDLLDEIWAPSEFIKQAVLATGTPKPVTLMPYPVLMTNSEFLPRTTYALQEGVFHFLFACDLHSFIERKNPIDVISAFQNAFPIERNDVRMVIKVHGKGGFAEVRRHILEAIDQDRRILLIDANLGRHAAESLHAACDAYISLHRSEGYGLNMAESMWLGKPVIATRYSGNLDFMSDENSCLVDFKMIPVLKGQYPRGEGQQWAAPDVHQASLYMRRIVDDRRFAAEIGARAASSVQHQLSLGTVGSKMRSRLEAIRLG